MARKPGTKKKTNSSGSKDRQKYFRIIIVLLILCFAVAAVGAACWGASQLLFYDNDRFVLRRVEFQGIAPGRTKALTNYLKLDLNRDKLFNIDIADLRRRLEGKSYIKSAEVYRVLPDTLKIKITQRIPIAYLFKYRSDWLLDEDMVVLNRNECIKFDYSLPVINGFKCFTIRAGEVMPDLKQAVKLIKLTNYEFKNMRLSLISLADAQKILFVMICDKRAYKVLIPPKNLETMMQVLHFALRQKQGKYKSTIDLTYKDQVIFR